MSTKIEWTDETWNPVTGCEPISPACKNCYAKRMAKRLAGRFGYNEKNPFDVTVHLDKLDQPFKWKKARKIFVCSMGDIFHEEVPPKIIGAIFGVMAAAKEHTFQVLTKRPENALRWFDWLYDHCQAEDGVYPWHVIGAFARNVLKDKPKELSEYTITKLLPGADWPLRNVWIGVTAENQQCADHRIPLLLGVPAVIRYVSIEPILSEVDLTEISCGDNLLIDALNKRYGPIDWVIVGGETGPGARMINTKWVRLIRDQCVEAGVPFFFKQYGKYIPGNELDGKVWRQFPNE